MVHSASLLFVLLCKRCSVSSSVPHVRLELISYFTAMEIILSKVLNSSTKLSLIHSRQ